MIYIFAALVLVGMASCSSEDSGWQEDEVEKTIVMFYPWSTTLLGEFKANVSDFSSVIASRGLHGERVVVCMATAPDDAVVYELTPCAAIITERSPRGSQWPRSLPT